MVHERAHPSGHVHASSQEESHRQRHRRSFLTEFNPTKSSSRTRPERSSPRNPSHQFRTRLQSHRSHCRFTVPVAHSPQQIPQDQPKAKSRPPRNLHLPPPQPPHPLPLHSLDHAQRTPSPPPSTPIGTTRRHRPMGVCRGLCAGGRGRAGEDGGGAQGRVKWDTGYDGERNEGPVDRDAREWGERRTASEKDSWKQG